MMGAKSLTNSPSKDKVSKLNIGRNMTIIRRVGIIDLILI